MKKIGLLALCAGALVLAACGDDDIGFDCGEGTVNVDGECVVDDGAPTTTVAPAGGQIPEDAPVALIADEQAKIYYTLDGSTPDTDSPGGESPVIIPSLPVDDGEVRLRFFAVDEDGNEESVREETFSLDVAPGPVAELSLTVTGADAALSWIEPDDNDLVGVVVARVDGVITSPERGDVFEEGDEIGPGTTVVFVGSAESFDEADLDPGFAQYAVWARDVWNNYSRVRTVGSLVEMAAQTGSLTIDVGAETASVTTAPANVGVAVGTVDFDDAITVTVPLTLTNPTSRALFNSKFVVTGVTGSLAGTVSGNDGTIGGDSDPYYHVKAALAPGASSDEFNLVLTTVLNTETIVVDFEVQDHPLIVGPTTWENYESGDEGLLFDTGGEQMVAGEVLVDIDDMAPNAQANYYGGGVSLDGRRLYVGGRQSSHLAIIDLATMTDVAHSAELTTGKGFVGPPILWADEDIVWTVATQGTHGNGNNIGHFPHRYFLIKLDASNLEELGRIELTSDLDEEQENLAKGVAISADRSMAGISVRSADAAGDPGELHLIDLPAMAEVDTDGDTAGVQPVAATSSNSLAFAPDGTKLYVGSVSDVSTDDVEVVDLTSAAYDITPLTVGDGAGAILSVGPDGLIYVGATGSSGDATAGMWTIDPADDSVVQLANYADFVGAFAWGADGGLWVRPGYNSADVCRIDLADDGTATCITGDGLDRRGHWLAVTPF